MDNADKIEILKQEYFKLQDYYESYDSKAQTIKGWVTTISVAAISAGFAYKSEFIWLLAVLTCVVFWVMEAKWKIFQYCYGERIRQIETAFKEDNYSNIVPLQIYSSWFIEFRKGKFRISSIMRLNLVMIPYLYVIITCLVLFILQWFSLFNFWHKG
jgi:hypothetical protein